ncbi:hypothetical protein KLER11_gp48 [Pararheinheimera phage vB_PsoM_KLER1-1]|nr:hypothetical protein KLER11_gp48 [Pararheinheimera phage vB_PsoM_KLER1-1]
MNNKQKIEQLARFHPVIRGALRSQHRGVSYEECLEMMIVALAESSQFMSDLLTKTAQIVPNTMLTVATKEQLDQIAEQFNVENQERP